MITVEELKRFVEGLPMDTREFRVATSDDQSDGLIMKYVGWAVYGMERGHGTEGRTFTSEDEACRHYLKCMRESLGPVVGPFFKLGEAALPQNTSLARREQILERIDEFLEGHQG